MYTVYFFICPALFCQPNRLGKLAEQVLWEESGYSLTVLLCVSVLLAWYLNIVNVIFFFLFGVHVTIKTHLVYCVAEYFSQIEILKSSNLALLKLLVKLYFIFIYFVNSLLKYPVHPSESKLFINKHTCFVIMLAEMLCVHLLHHTLSFCVMAKTNPWVKNKHYSILAWCALIASLALATHCQQSSETSIVQCASSG